MEHCNASMVFLNHRFECIRRPGHNGKHRDEGAMYPDSPFNDPPMVFGTVKW